MEIKGTNSLHVSQTLSGKICLEQWSDDYAEPVFVYFTLEQFRRIQRWVDENEVEIDEAWNGGVEDETEA